MEQDTQEPQLWHESKDDKLAPRIQIIATLLLVAFSFMAGLGISNKYQITQNTPVAEKAADDPTIKCGSFVILENNTTSITFTGFEGRLVWYRSHDHNRFHPTGFATIENQKPIRVPKDTHAFLKTGKVLGETYSIDTTIHTN